VLEIASRRTGSVDTGEKRSYYEELGIGEYWRFDETGEFHGAMLGGDLLVEGEYVPVEIEELPDGELQGYSPALNIYLRWEDGALVFHDPATGEPIASLESELQGRFVAESRAREEEAARLAAQARAETAEVRAEEEEAARLAAEARMAELEEELRRLRGE